MVARVIDHPFSAGVIPTPYNPDPVLLAIVETIRAGLIRDQHVRLHKFGTFRLRWSKERRVRHPKSGESITVPPAPRITFTPAKQLREWIDPDRKPAIPLEESVKPAPETQQTRTAVLTKPSQATDEHQPQAQPNLQETVQDIIDEQYTPPDSLSGIVNSQPEIRIEAQAEARTTDVYKPNKKWALGLLAAVPLIIYLLQADFTNDAPDAHKMVPTAPATTLETVSTPEIPSESMVTNNNIVRTEITSGFSQSSIDNTSIDNNIQTEETVPDFNQQSFNSTNIGTDIRSENVAPDKEQTNTSDISTTSISAQSEPTTNPFYMSPQVHTIQKGENLWNLAKQFYGDALLWPHIYRANIRTLSDPDKILSGKQLVIPGLQQSPESLTVKDKELIAEGYYLVYQFNKMKASNQAIHFLIGAKQYSSEWLQQKRPLITKKDWRSIKEMTIK